MLAVSTDDEYILYSSATTIEVIDIYELRHHEKFHLIIVRSSRPEPIYMMSS